MATDGKYWSCADCGALVEGDPKPEACDECGGKSLTWAYTQATVYSGSVTGFAAAVEGMFREDADGK